MGAKASASHQLAGVKNKNVAVCLQVCNYFVLCSLCVFVRVRVFSVCSRNFVYVFIFYFDVAPISNGEKLVALRVFVHAVFHIYRKVITKNIIVIIFPDVVVWQMAMQIPRIV